MQAVPADMLAVPADDRAVTLRKRPPQAAARVYDSGVGSREDRSGIIDPATPDFARPKTCIVWGKGKAAGFAFPAALLCVVRMFKVGALWGVV